MRGRHDSTDDHDPSNEDLMGLGGEGGELREQDRFLPIANVARIMKRGIPTEQVFNGAWVVCRSQRILKRGDPLRKAT